jgi:spermidine synthase/cytochrome c-type biogenesis protein CcmH/NrfG
VAGLGAGSWLGARLAQRSQAPRRLYGRLQVALAVSVALTVALLAGHAPRVASMAARLQDHPLAFQGAGLFLVLLTLAVPAMLIGAALPVACRLAAARSGVGRGIGSTFAWLTAGNVAGALLAGLVLPAVIGTRGVLLLSAGLFALVAVGVSRRPGRRSVQAAVALGFAAWLMPPWDPALMASNPAGLGSAYRAAARATSSTIAQAMRSRGEFLFVEEGADALVTVRRLPGGHSSLQINGRTEASTGHDLPSQVLAAHVPLLHVLAPRRVMVIGLASGVTTGSLLTRAPESVVVAEIAPGIRRALDSGAFDQVSGRPWEDPRVHIINADARSVLLQQDAAYDLIASQPSHPWVPGVAGLYTEEFYRLVHGRLTPAGVFGQWVQGYGLTLDDLRQVMRTFISVFPHAALYEESVGGGDYFLVGSKEPLLSSAASLLQNWTPAVAADLARVAVTSPGALLARRLLDREGLQAFAGEGELLTDDRLRLAYSTPLSRWSPSVAHQVGVLERDRHPRLQDLDLAGLLPAEQGQLMADLAAAEMVRRRDRTFLDLLEEDAFARLATPEISQVVAMVRVGLFRAAYSLLLEFLTDDPGGAALQLLAGDLALRLGEMGLARVHYESCLAQQPQTPAAQAGLGHVLLRTGDVEQAALVLRAAVEGDPLLASAWSNLGLALRRSGTPHDAEEAYRHALALDPALASAWYNLGRLLHAAQRQEEAEAAYRSGLEVAPADCDLRLALAQLLPVAAGLSLAAPCGAEQPGVPVSQARPAGPGAADSPSIPALQGSAR